METKSSKTMFLYCSFTLYLRRGAFQKVFSFLILVFPGACGVKPPLQTNTPIYSLTSQHIKLLHVIQSLQSLQSYLSNWQPIRCRPQAFLAWVQVQKVSRVRTAPEQSSSFWKWKQGPQHEDKRLSFSCSFSKHSLVDGLWYGLVSRKAGFSSSKYHLLYGNYRMADNVCMTCPAILVSLYTQAHLPVLSSLIMDALQ